MEMTTNERLAKRKASNEALAKITAIKEEVGKVFKEVSYIQQKYHNLTLEVDGTLITINFNDPIRFVEDAAIRAYIYKATGSSPDGEKAYYFKKAYQAGKVTSNKDYKKYSLKQLKALL